MLPTLHGRDEYIYIYSYIKSYHIYIYIKALAQTKHYTHHTLHDATICDRPIRSDLPWFICEAGKGFWWKEKHVWSTKMVINEI